jgi:diguanylate cyclase (GGDEF)-like protein
MRAELHRRQVVDELTGLYNARGFEQLATHYLRLADRSKRPVVLVFVRLEQAGDVELDAAVAGAAEALSSTVRDSDVVARVGADAFCVLLTGDAAGAESIVLSASSRPWRPTTPARARGACRSRSPRRPTTPITRWAWRS